MSPASTVVWAWRQTYEIAARCVKIADTFSLRLFSRVVGKKLNIPNWNSTADDAITQDGMKDQRSPIQICIKGDYCSLLYSVCVCGGVCASLPLHFI